MFQEYFPSDESRFRGIFFLENRFRKNGVGDSLLGRGSGSKNYSSDLPPDFKKVFWSRKGSPWGATEIIPNDFWAEFHEDAEFEVKSAVASYSQKQNTSSEQHKVQVQVKYK